MGNKALYAGSFDPVSLGHLDLIERASKICDELVVGVIRNPNKKSMFTEEQRMEMIRRATSHLPNVTVDAFSGLLADYVNASGFNMVIRGLRGTTDFDSEIQMAQLHQVLYNDNVETVFLMTSPQHSFVSSSMAKEVYALGGDVSSLVSDEVLKMMNEYTGREE